MEDVGIFYGHIVYFASLWYSVSIWTVLWLFGILFLYLVCYTKKNLATLPGKEIQYMRYHPYFLQIVSVYTYIYVCMNVCTYVPTYTGTWISRDSLLRRTKINSEAFIL
jgi:hypothetical protein